MSKPKNPISRRKFIEGTGAALVAATAVPVALDAQSPAAQSAAAEPGAGSRSTIRVTINGTERRLEVGDHWTLVELLRDHLMLTGTKIGCDRGECGACTVLLDGNPIYSCSYLAAWADGHTIETVEGLVKGDRLDPLQQAFIDCDGPQCGFCTSGQIMSAKALLASNASPTADQVRSALSGNICRCSNYNRYVEAVVAAGATAQRGRRGTKNGGAL
jgi:xanthine dehydrogenase YagT iron-sulfur-binding subunit